jgi:peptide/nickel transport system substrate-binding protein
MRKGIKNLLICLVVLMILTSINFVIIAKEKGGTLVIGVSQGPEFLDPALTRAHAGMVIQYNIGGYLVRTDENLGLYPAIAKEWESPDEGKTWLFYLREGVKFHNGRELVAEDVKYSFTRTMDPILESRYRGDLDIIQSMEVVDDYTIKIELTNNNADFPRIISDSNASAGVIVPKEEAEKSEFKTHPISAGPFMFESYTPDLEIVLVKNPDYFSNTNYLERIVLKIIPDSSVRLNALKAGDIDLTYGFAYERLDEVREHDDLNLFEVPSVWNELLWFNTKKPPFNDPHLRKAVVLNLKYDEIAQGAISGEAIVDNSLLSPIVREAWDIPNLINFTYQPEKAKEYKEFAGYTEDENIKAKLILMPGYSEFERVALIIKEQLKELNIEVDYTPLELGEYFDASSSGDYNILITGFSEGGSPEIELKRYLGPESQWNLWGPKNYALGELMDKGAATLNSEERSMLYATANTVAQEMTYWVTLYWRLQAVAASKDVKGFKSTPQNVLFFDGVWKE